MSKSHRAKPSNQVRIIGGDWRGRKLQFPSIEGLRPTPDRVRETLFNWLSPHIAGAHCLDLYAGSGALGFEALSRGARSCCFIDNNKQVQAALGSSVQALNCEDRANVILADSGSVITLDHSIDLVFLDPPFALKNPAIYLSKVKHLVKKNGLVYLENKCSTSITLDSEVECWRSARAGTIYYGLYRIL